MATLFPETDTDINPQSTVDELKARLDWGEPALTIIDVRARDAFNESRITGAISLPQTNLAEAASGTLEKDRDIYIYGDSDGTASEAAAQLKEAGYQNVATIAGGLAAWKAAQYPVEGR